MSLFADYHPDQAGQPDHRVHVRLARIADIPPLSDICAERQGISATEAQIKFERELANPVSANLLWIAEVESTVIGFGRASLQDRPADAEPDHPPAGWFLTGVVVAPDWRRRGAGRALTRARLDFLVAEGISEVFFIVAAINGPSLDLHEALGFERVTDKVNAPGVQFTGGRGFLCRLDLRKWRGSPDPLETPPL
jgi:ribosomal protein S18 acetylase RimI-like enzyme